MNTEGTKHVVSSQLNKREEAWSPRGMLSVTKRLVAMRRLLWRRIYASVHVVLGHLR